tara:strand:+ start:8135 stop:9520 length:1386 start_codon:yes stop_codon:yes gene_type:complete
MKSLQKVLVVGAGMAGSEAAFFLASRGVQVVLAECKTKKLNPAQKMVHFAELVCTNSLKSLNPDSGHGLLKYDMEKMNSLVLKIGKETAVPAGDALAVDREVFAKKITEVMHEHPNIKVVEEDVTDPLTSMKNHECDFVILATGPLTTEGLEKWMTDDLGQEDFYFYDAIAPVVDAEGLDYTKLYHKDRHKPVPEDEGVEADYLNAPMNKEQYEAFIKELVAAEKVPSKDFEDYKFFESCLPVDIMAERGIDTARFSCMKPIGLEMPNGEIPYACVQLRKENLMGSAFNLVGFQTRLKYPEQKRVFRMIPGLENASFLHLGSVHRNSFLNSKRLLNEDFSSKKHPQIHFAGQITGVEGYTESATMGLYVALQVLLKLNDKSPVKFPVETATGALVNYVMTAHRPAPSNINFGLLPTIVLTKEERRDRKNRKKIKKAKVSAIARESLDQFFNQDTLKELLGN